MKIDAAIQLEAQGNLEQAAAVYERIFAEDETQIEALLNLAVLYWQATDFGFSAGNNLSLDFVTHAGRRLRELLSLDVANLSFLFWKRYIAWAVQVE